MSSLFDPVSLMNENLDANATRRDPLPAGEVLAQITELKFADGVSAKTGNPWNRMDISLEITDPNYLAQYPGGAEKLTTQLGIMLDMNNGQIATGPNKNIRLGRLREAANANGKPLAALVGTFIRISIAHKPHYLRPEEIVDEVVAFTKP